MVYFVVFTLKGISIERDGFDLVIYGLIIFTVARINYSLTSASISLIGGGTRAG